MPATIKVTVRIIQQDLVLPNFPCMPAELTCKFIEKMCQQFNLNKDAIRLLSGSRLIKF